MGRDYQLGVGGSGPPAPDTTLSGMLKYILAAIIVSLVVDALDGTNQKAAVMLAAIIVLLVLMTYQTQLQTLVS